MSIAENNKQIGREWFERYLNGEAITEINKDLFVEGADFQAVSMPNFLTGQKLSWKPKTFKLNGIDVPSPVQKPPRPFEKFSFRNSTCQKGYTTMIWPSREDENFLALFKNGIWKPEHIEKIIAADRSVNGSNNNEL